jgi:exopolyphosphatase/guanosine-5'-triphosphate,3'-diphosphate pyrophosphatase
LEQLRAYMLKIGDVQKLNLQGLRPDRMHSLAGGLAIMTAAFAELNIDKMQLATTALREGVLYDLWGRSHDDDIRDVTVQQFMQRYRVDVRQAQRVTELACNLAKQFIGEDADENSLQTLEWASKLHEIGISVAHGGYHKHTAYILANADMPGFSKKDQQRLSQLAVAQRGSLEKIRTQLVTVEDYVMTLSLRLAVLFFRSRSSGELPPIQAHFSGTKFHLSLPVGWLKLNPLTETALTEEIKQWNSLGVSFQLLEL